MFLRLVADSFSRRPRHKLLTGAALALGMAVATAALSVSLDVGDRLAHEFRSLGANLLVTPQADSLPLEIGGVDYGPLTLAPICRSLISASSRQFFGGTTLSALRLQWKLLSMLGPSLRKRTRRRLSRRTPL